MSATKRNHVVSSAAIFSQRQDMLTDNLHHVLALALVSIAIIDGPDPALLVIENAIHCVSAPTRAPSLAYRMFSAGHAV